MGLLAVIDPELSALVGAITGLITALGAIWVKSRSARTKAINDDVNNTIRLTEAMSNVIDVLERELDATSHRISECQKTIAERDEAILQLRSELHNLYMQIRELRHRLGEDS